MTRRRVDFTGPVGEPRKTEISVLKAPALIGATGLTELKGVGSDLRELSVVSTVFESAKPEKSITVAFPVNPFAVGGGYNDQGPTSWF